jgi:hypothetical protein
MSWNITGAPGTGEDLLYSQAGTPTLDLRFASSKNLNDYVSGQNLITYTRAGDATFFDANGTIQTAGANTPRFDHNPATGESLGLLIEEARTNLLLNSETLSTQSVTVTAAAHTLSFYGTGTVTLSGTHSATVVGTGAFPTRTTLTFTPTSGSLTVTVSGTVQYAQVELGAFATSWIPTTGSTATRSRDEASITGTNFSRWYSQSAGTVFFDVFREFPVPSGQFLGVWHANESATNGSRVVLSYLTEALGFQQVLVDGTQTVNVFPSGLNAVRRRVAAGGFAKDDFYSIYNGNAAGAITTATGLVPSNIRQVFIGAANNFASPLCGTIRRLTYFDRRLPNATLQAITA